VLLVLKLPVPVVLALVMCVLIRAIESDSASASVLALFRRELILSRCFAIINLLHSIEQYRERHESDYILLIFSWETIAAQKRNRPLDVDSPSNLSTPPTTAAVNHLPPTPASNYKNSSPMTTLFSSDTSNNTVNKALLLTIKNSTGTILFILTS